MGLWVRLVAAPYLMVCMKSGYTALGGGASWVYIQLPTPGRIGGAVPGMDGAVPGMGAPGRGGPAAPGGCWYGGTVVYDNGGGDDRKMRQQEHTVLCVPLPIGLGALPPGGGCMDGGAIMGAPGMNKGICSQLESVDGCLKAMLIATMTDACDRTKCA